MAERFTNVHHPENLPWPVVYGRALLTPLATCMLPVMILTLVGVLEGVRVVPHVFWAAGAAVLLASAWTSFRLRSRIVEVQIDDGWVRVRSAWDVVHRRREPRRRLLEVRDYGSWADVTVGLASYELQREDWPEYERLVEVLSSVRNDLYMQ